MKNIEQMQLSVLQWEKANGIVTSIDRARHLVDAQVALYHESSHEAKLFALGGWFFTAVLLDNAIKLAGKDYHSSMIDCLNIIREKATEKHVHAVLQSNWTKYVQSKDTGMFRMSQEAASVAEKYQGRYSSVVPVRIGQYFFIRGLEQGKDGRLYEKVLKPSTFISPEKFLS